MSSPVLTAPEQERERLARVALNLLFEPGDRRLDGFMAGMDAYELFCALRATPHDQRLRDARDDVATRLDSMRPDQVLDDADRLGIRFVIPGDAEWPAQVEDLFGQEPVQERTGVPLGLWVKGPLRLGDLDRSVAVVGSRSATSYGVDAAGQIAYGIADKGFVVVSGGAIGIDAAAHRGALAARGRTVAVLACGVDRFYPKENMRLLQAALDTGALVSELAPGLPVTRMRFLARNRVIAALARGTVLAEAAPRSGALNTANWTTKLNRQLMCVPGPISAIQSLGVLEQVRSGKGMIVTRGEEALELVSRPGEFLVEERRGPERKRDRLSTRHRQVLDGVPAGRGGSSLSISRSSGVAFAEVASALLHLEKAGLVERVPDGWQLTAEAIRS
ncbi:DNA-processing protein DprA [Nocardioides sp. KR10-350]|uniref:DNA-processing protein DprA n=1 Tax=Nocardioides cheoyonin TaxID=3156615 RepID=UPI0032B5BA1C